MKVTDKFVFFFTGKDVFSNFYPVRFTHDGHTFISSEQAVMYRKAKFFGAEEIAKRILQAKTPERAKELGRSEEIPFEQSAWEQNREAIYESVLLDKFRTGSIREQLLRTGQKTLVEASPYDKIWGIKLAITHPDIENPSKWRGQNLLGKVLERVREQLR
ncbi:MULTISPECIES: NADAR family protein [unclassified Psychrobacillus]|uniref:NADAR family protein n=1 Tax=unclassified Psychrobacillus TaxID=2636677 RepID=UPI0030FA3157